MDHEAIESAVRERFKRKPIEVLLAVAAMAQNALQVATAAAMFGRDHEHTYGGSATLPPKMTRQSISGEPNNLDKLRAAYQLSVVLGIEEPGQQVDEQSEPLI